MLFEEYESKIQTGDLLIWSESGGVGWSNTIYPIMIRIATRSSYHHVGIALRLDGVLFVIEAMPPLVRIFPIKLKPNFKHIHVHDIDRGHETRNELLSYIGDPYSVKQAIVSYFTKPKEDRSWQCVEMAHDFYTKKGFSMGKDFTPEGFVSRAMDVFGAMNSVKFNKLD